MRTDTLEGNPGGFQGQCVFPLVSFDRYANCGRDVKKIHIVERDKKKENQGCIYLVTWRLPYRREFTLVQSRYTFITEQAIRLRGHPGGMLYRREILIPIQNGAVAS